MATYSLTLRGQNQSKLTIEELDNNFLYVLENATGGGGGATGPQGSTGPQGPAGSAPLVELSSGFEPNVISGFYKTDEKFTFSGQTSSSWRLLASVPLFGTQGPTNVYVKYIGKIVAPVEVEPNDVNLGQQQSAFYSSDSDFDRVTSHFGPSGLVTDDSGYAVPVGFAGLMIDNSSISNEYEIFVLAGSQGNFESVAIIDTFISAPDGFELTLDRGTPVV
jgi:hypothetical protein